MTASEVLLLSINMIMVIAVISGPILAVRITRQMDLQKEVRDRKIAVFSTLMSTRATNLSPAHIEALNAIDIEFNGLRPQERDVRHAWKAYLDHLGDKEYPVEQWGVKRVDLLVELLYKMGLCLGYDFDKAQIKNGIYHPQMHGEIETDQHVIRRGLRALLEGRISLLVRLEPEVAPSEPGLPLLAELAPSSRRPAK